MEQEREIPVQTIKRMPFYLRYLEGIYEEGIEFISAPKIAQDLSMNEVSVKKDLSYVTVEAGKPRVGHKVINLIHGLKEYLGYNDTKSACLIGVGNLGKALLYHKGFAKYGLEIVAAFDNNIDLIGKKENNVVIMPMAKLSVIKDLDIPIGIICVPDNYAQKVCDQLVEVGVCGIWNFSSVKLTVPEGVEVQNENMASSLAVLSNKIKK